MNQLLNKMFREQNYENAFTLNISDIDITGFGRNSDSDMQTFRNCDVERFEIQTGDIKTPPTEQGLSSVVRKDNSCVILNKLCYSLSN